MSNNRLIGSSLNVRKPMIDHARRMFNEALDRLSDADLLSRSVRKQSDSDALLRILAFEVLLKCAIHITGKEPARSHVYTMLWGALPGHVRTEVLDVASTRMPGHADLSQLDELLKWYQFIFEKARYHYELYEGYSSDEYRELSQLWEELGAPTHEAVVQYHPTELYCLIEGLKTFIEKRLANPSLDRDAPKSGAPVI